MTIHKAARGVQDMILRCVKTKAGVDEAERRKNRTKARVRAIVLHPLARPRFPRARYHGLKKNHERLYAGFAPANLRAVAQGALCVSRNH